MRPIKFRLWIPRIKGFHFWGEGEDGEFIGPAEATWRESEQFAAMLDKDGKEIYEGDILLMGDGVRGQLIWCQDRAEFYVVAVSGQIYCPGYTYRGRMKNKIIGNIHENPELLKEDA